MDFLEVANRPTFDITVELDADGVLESPQLPGFSVRLAEVFRQ